MKKITVALLLVGVGMASASLERGASVLRDDSLSRPDAELATELLRNVNGANAVLCSAVERMFMTGNWGLSLTLEPDTATEELMSWIGRGHIDRSAFDVARSAFGSADACTRRIAAQIAGRADVQRIDTQLRSELASSDVNVRITAVRALGYAGEETSLPALNEMLRDRERMVRLTAIWALGRIGDDSSSATLINILKNDADADARRLAAYALGRIHG